MSKRPSSSSEDNFYHLRRAPIHMETTTVFIDDILSRIKNFKRKEAEWKFDYIKIPIDPIGDHPVDLRLFKSRNRLDPGELWIGVSNEHDMNVMYIQSVLVKACYGGQTFEKNFEDCYRVPPSKWRTYELMAFDELEEGIKASGNGSLKLQVTVTLLQGEGDQAENQWIIRKKPRLDTNNADTLLADISQDRDFTDFTIKSEEGDQFNCHRTVLAVQSEVLKRMFLSDMEERKTATLALKYKKIVVDNFIKFLYNRKIEDDHLEENIGSYLELSEKYNIQKMKEHVEYLIIMKLNKENMVDMFLLADLYSVQFLKEAAKDMIRRNKLSMKENFDVLDEKLNKSQMMKLTMALLD